jgi:transposase
VKIRLRCEDVIIPKPDPLEFRRDIVAVARKYEAPLSQIAKDFGISESCLSGWLEKADVEDGVAPGVTSTESAEPRDAKKRIRLEGTYHRRRRERRPGKLNPIEFETMNVPLQAARDQ